MPRKRQSNFATIAVGIGALLLIANFKRPAPTPTPDFPPAQSPTIAPAYTSERVGPTKEEIAFAIAERKRIEAEEKFFAAKAKRDLQEAEAWTKQQRKAAQQPVPAYDNSRYSNEGYNDANAYGGVEPGGYNYNPPTYEPGNGFGAPGGYGNYSSTRSRRSYSRKAWNPALHPRDSRGRFISTGGRKRR